MKITIIDDPKDRVLPKLRFPLLVNAPVSASKVRAPANRVFYKVLFRTGFRLKYRWRDLSGVYIMKKANELRERLKQGGAHVALVTEGVFNALGMPTTFNHHDSYK